MNIDHRLDLYNSLDEFLGKVTEKDSLIIISSNTESGDTIVSGYGDMMTLVSAFLAYPDKNKLEYIQMKDFILNLAINILDEDKNQKDMFFNELKKDY